jgi:tetratricopeptide (TPR) repeat protein
MRCVALLLAFLLAPLLTGAALASPGTHREAARRFEAADRAFRDGRYDDALLDLEAAWELEPRPELLISLAQAYRALGRNEEALERCEQYLAVAPKGALVERVGELARSLRREISHRAVAPKPAVVEVVEREEEGDEPDEPAPEPRRIAARAPEAPALAVHPAVVARPATPAPLVEAPPPPAPSRMTRTSWGLVAGGVIVAVGLGLGIGLGVGLQSSSSAPSTHLGTVSFH